MLSEINTGSVPGFSGDMYLLRVTRIRSQPTRLRAAYRLTLGFSPLMNSTKGSSYEKQWKYLKRSVLPLLMINCFYAGGWGMQNKRKISINLTPYF